MKEEYAKALFLLAGIEVLAMYRLENEYWPLTPDYEKERRESPWWLVKTSFGLIKIGWRKRVISIDWSDTAFRRLNLTKDDVTKTETSVHAYSYIKALEYLTSLRIEANP
jgi:hypothetical protein